MGDYVDGWITVRKSKNKKMHRLPCPDELMDWLDQHMVRTPGGPLFLNHYVGRGEHPTAHSNWKALWKLWRKACVEVGIEYTMYSGTKHTFATNTEAVEDVMQRILGHKDVRSTRRYRQLKDAAIVSVLRPPPR